MVQLVALALLLTEVSSVYVWSGTKWKWEDREEGSGDGDTLDDDEYEYTPLVFDRPTYETQITEEDDRNLPKRILKVQNIIN